MGKGDRKSRKGKIAAGSYGNSRPHKPNKGESTTETKPKVKKKASPKKASPKKQAKKKE